MNYYLRAQEVVKLVRNAAPEQRPAIIERECGSDARVREEVEAQLKDLAEAMTAPVRDMTGPAIPGWEPSGEAIALSPGSCVGAYTLVRRIDEGVGAFGEVHLADEPGLKRQVAIKFLKQGIELSSNMLVRFQQECETQAAMDHPNIARVYGNGVHQGRPYLVMEYVDGRRIDAHCREENLSLREVVNLFISVCEAVRHAHDRGTIHRDLKPSNILVDRASGTARVIDFGISKLMRFEGAHGASRNPAQTVGPVGTPAYMSPEQAGGGDGTQTPDVTAKSDVYALGAVMYQLLTGSVPIDQPSSDRAEICRRLLSEVPVRPSVRLGEPASRQGSGQTGSVSRWTGQDLAEELDWIVGKCLAKQPTERYETVAALIDDLRRYLGGVWPVGACPPNRLYAAKKYYRRNRAAVLAAAVLALAVVGGLAGTTYGLVQARAARAEETRRRLELDQVVEYQRAWLEGFEPQRFGDHLRAQLLAEVRAESERVGGGDDQTRAVAAAEDAVRRLDFTKLAVSVLDSQYLSRAMAAIRDQLDGQPRVQVQMLTELMRTRSNWGLGGSITPAGGSADGNAAATGALEVAELQYEIVSEHLSDDDAQVVRSMSNLGGLLSELGRPEDAERLLTAAVARGESVLGKHALATADAKLSLGVHRWRGQAYAESERLLREVVTVRERRLGPDHRLTIEARMNLGTTLDALGRRDEALAIRRECVARFRATVGPDDRATLIAEQNLLSGLALRAEHADEARALADDVVVRARRILGGAHPRTIALQNNRIAAAIYRGDRTGASAYTQEVLQEVKAALGERHEMIFGLRGNELLIGLMPPRTEAEFRQVLARAEDFADEADEVLGPRHERAIHARLLLANAQHACGRTDEACETVQAIQPRAVEALGPGHSVTRQIQFALGQVCRKQ